MTEQLNDAIIDTNLKDEEMILNDNITNLKVNDVGEKTAEGGSGRTGRKLHWSYLTVKKIITKTLLELKMSGKSTTGETAS